VAKPDCSSSLEILTSRSDLRLLAWSSLASFSVDFHGDAQEREERMMLIREKEFAHCDRRIIKHKI
jgi:hypothetical protein